MLYQFCRLLIFSRWTVDIILCCSVSCGKNRSYSLQLHIRKLSFSSSVQCHLCEKGQLLSYDLSFQVSNAGNDFQSLN